MAKSPNKIYFLKHDDGPWEHVSKEEWVRAERNAGFVNTMGRPLEPGTSSFGATKHGRTVNGRIVNIEYFKPDDYDWDPAYRDAVTPVAEAAKIWFDPKWKDEAKAEVLEQARKAIFEGETDG